VQTSIQTYFPRHFFENMRVEMCSFRTKQEAGMLCCRVLRHKLQLTKSLLFTYFLRFGPLGGPLRINSFFTALLRPFMSAIFYAQFGYLYTFHPKKCTEEEIKQLVEEVFMYFCNIYVCVYIHTHVHRMYHTTIRTGIQESM
jgi:hypothetical protein